MPDIIIRNRDFIALTCINSKSLDVCRDIEDLFHKSGNDKNILELDPQNSSFELPDQPYTPYSGEMGFILWEPKNTPDKCAFMATFEDGWATLIHNIGINYKHECLNIRISKITVTYPICEFLYYQSGVEKRFIRSMKDDPRWEFYQKGESLSFEKLNYYNKRRIKDRFTEKLLLEYMNILGWDISENKFWDTEKPYYKM
jgi:hypothetical protein